MRNLLLLQLTIAIAIITRVMAKLILQHNREWSMPPRIAKRNSREWEFIQRWKDLDKELKEQKDALDAKYKAMEQQLEQEVEEILVKENYEMQQQQKLREEQMQQQIQQQRFGNNDLQL